MWSWTWDPSSAESNDEWYLSALFVSCRGFFLYMALIVEVVHLIRMHTDVIGSSSAATLRRSTMVASHSRIVRV